MANKPPKRQVHPTTLLQMFKDLGYERAILDRRAPAGKPYRDMPGPPHQPPGTRSQTVPYSLMGVKIAVCHQYVLPDGSFGASGLPDPKLLQYRGHVLFCHSAQPRCDCAKCLAPPENWRAVIEEMSRGG
jgi:hypothetical protein